MKSTTTNNQRLGPTRSRQKPSRPGRGSLSQRSGCAIVARIPAACGVISGCSSAMCREASASTTTRRPSGSTRSRTGGGSVTGRHVRALDSTRPGGSFRRGDRGLRPRPARRWRRPSRCPLAHVLRRRRRRRCGSRRDARTVFGEARTPEGFARAAVEEEAGTSPGRGAPTSRRTRSTCACRRVPDPPWLGESGDVGRS